MRAGRRQRRIGHRACCSDVVHSRRVAPRTAGVSVRKQQPADCRQQGNPAPGPTVHEMRDEIVVVICDVQNVPCIWDSSRWQKPLNGFLLLRNLRFYFFKLKIQTTEFHFLRSVAYNVTNLTKNIAIANGLRVRPCSRFLGKLLMKANSYFI